MTVRSVPSGSGYRPVLARTSGSKPGKKMVDWMRPPFVYYKIAAQKIILRARPDCVHTRQFGGATQMAPLLEHARRYDPEVYAALLDKGNGEERTPVEMVSVLYDRGHKAFYRNKHEKVAGGRAAISDESYTNSPKLQPYVKEAELKFARILGIDIAKRPYR